MPARESESLVLRTYPYREADLVVSFLARDRGRLRGIARGVRRPKSRWGSGLERLSHARLFYFLRENQELARLDRCELSSPPIFLKADYATSVALDFIVEVTERLLPEHEPNDAFFRLLLLVIEELRAGLNGQLEPPPGTAPAEAPVLPGPKSNGDGGGTSQDAGRWAGAEFGDAPGWLWRTLTYFALWSVRLGGWMPPLDVCIQSGVELGSGEIVYYEQSQPGLFSADYRTRDSRPLAAESRRTAHEMLRRPLPELRGRRWDRGAAADLRQFLVQRLEAQFECRLKTVAVLAQF